MSHPTDKSSRRVFGLADAMLLTAATAAALSCLRIPLERRLTFIADGRIIDHLRPATLVGASFVGCWGIALLAIELRSAPLRSKGWTSRPGLAACATATAGALIRLSVLLIWGATENYRFEGWYVPSILGQLVEPAAMSVIAGWFTLWLVGMWRSERTWSDYFGIMIGVAWIALYGLSWAALCLE